MTNAGLTSPADTSLMINIRHFLLVVLIFMPGVSTSLMSLVPLAAFVLLTIVHGNIQRQMLFLLVGLLLLTIVVMFLRNTTEIALVSVRDLTEAIRLLSLLTTVAVVLGVTDVQFVRRLLMALLLADLIVSLSQLQVLPSAIGGVFGHFYQSSFHLENALGISKRALGLYPDPTTHGLAMGLLALFFLGYTVNSKDTHRLIASLTALSLVAMSQSQTAFISTVLGIVTLFFFKVITQPTLRVTILLGALFGGALALLLRYAEELSYLFLLFKVGLNRNSFQRRIQKREDSLEIMHDEPLGVVLGWGKDYLGSTSAALDNEYLFVYLVYGLPGLFLFLAILVALLIHGILTKSHVLLASTVLGVVAAYPASFFTSFKTFTLYCLVVSGTIAVNKLPAILKR